MSPFAGQLLLSSVIPLIVAGVRSGIKTVETEDERELIQDAVAIAASMIDSAERREKPIIPKSVAYYALQTLKSGRRSTSAGRTDALAVTTMLDGNSAIISMEQPLVDGDDEDEDERTVGDMLAARHDDPSFLAGRRIDWEAVESCMDGRGKSLLHDLAAGLQGKEIAGRMFVTPPRVCQMKEALRRSIEEAWGEDTEHILAHSSDRPAWRTAMENRRV